MKKIIKTAILLALGFQIQAQTPKVNVKSEIEFAEKQYQLMLKEHPDVNKFPQSLMPDGSFYDSGSDGWCSGFLGGSLWYLFEYTQKPEWKLAADKWTMAVEREKYNKTNHDLGFMLYCPFGNGYRLTQKPVYKEIMLEGAKSLSTRFYPAVGVIKSWDRFTSWDEGVNYYYPVIIDNMMNLEFLFWAARESKDKKYYDIAISHADKTIQHHYRPDFSCYHVVCYDSTNGNVITNKTAQGYANESSWARGQTWGLYGYTMMYRETKDKKYLDQAIKIAAFIMNNPKIPADKVPYWDYDAPKIPNLERDASSAAITASALLELCKYDKANESKYFKYAEDVLISLSSPAYKSKLGENKGYLLMHSVGSIPHGRNNKAKSGGEIDKPLIYADYYFLEALLRYDTFFKKK